MRGVDVAVVYDDIGSSSLVKDMFKRLRERGRVMRFNPVVSHILWRKNPFFRTHRKMLVADSLAFVGGMNISEDYAGAKHSGTGRFHDAHLRIQGKN
jgi:cardiolipin synthase